MVHVIWIYLGNFQETLDIYHDQFWFQSIGPFLGSDDIRIYKHDMRHARGQSWTSEKRDEKHDQWEWNHSASG